MEKIPKKLNNKPRATKHALKSIMKMKREAARTCLFIEGKKSIGGCKSIANKHIAKSRLKIEQEYK